MPQASTQPTLISAFLNINHANPHCLYTYIYICRVRSQIKIIQGKKNPKNQPTKKKPKPTPPKKNNKTPKLPPFSLKAQHEVEPFTYSKLKMKNSSALSLSFKSDPVFTPPRSSYKR